MQKFFHRLAYSLLAASSTLFGAAAVTRAEVGANQLTRPEALSGWQLLFDGKSLDAWRNYQKQEISDGWKVVDGAIVRDGDKAGDLITKKKYKYFELSLEYNISEGGNSGLMFHVTEDHPKPYNSGPEIQIQDNLAGRDAQKAGWLYQLYKPTAPSWVKEDGVLDATRPAGQWNQLFLRIAPAQCEVSMNGQLYYRFKLGSKDWNDLVAKSKFAKMEGFGQAGEGYICLQDHGNLVSFRNIKVREIAEDGSVPQPIDGKLNMQSELAFPKLQFADWEPVDAGGQVRKLRLMELTYAAGDKSKLFAAGQLGTVWVFENRPDVEQSHLFLDIQDKVTQWTSNGANEQGLLGLALHPKYTQNGQFFVYYTRRADHASIVSRFQVSKDNPHQADPNSEEILLARG
jgi:hypothetical protein